MNEISKIDKKDFPDKLKKIKNPPNKLYAIGNIKLLYEECFAVVGTRKITKYGTENCRFFTKELVLRQIPIVSGMAIGTDTVAHITAIENKGKTIAVLGSGFNNIFPKENLNLFNEIIESGGLVVTEFEKDVPPLKENFPKRNRIVTALSEGVLVIEAGYRSGTSITVKNAKQQGKLTFALPGKLDSCVGIGVNNMIKEGSILTTKIEDILEHYPQFENRKRITISSKIVFDVKEEYKDILKIIKESPKRIEDILEEVDYNLQNLLKIITNMEIEGLIEKDFSGLIKIKE